MHQSAVKESAQRETRDPVARAFTVLLWMGDAAGASWGLREIAKGVAMHPSTLFRVLSHLQAGGLIQQDPETSRYSLGLGFLRLAWKVADRNSVRELALPWLKELVHATEETSLLALYDPSRQEMMFAATVDSPHPIRQVRQIAEWLPVTAGATGLAILAFLSDAEQRAILGRPLPTITPQTTTDRATLEQALTRVRQQGYALTRGERTPGAVGVGAPIFGPTGRVIGSVGITLPEQRFRPEDERQQAERVIGSARKITEQLSGSAH